jgi:hypothetical protein
MQTDSLSANVWDWSPHMSFILKGSQISAEEGSVKSKTSVQEYRNEIQSSYQTWYMFPVQCEELWIDHLTPLLVVTMPYACWFLWRTYYIEDFKWRLHFQFGVAFWRIVLLKRGIFSKTKSRLKGIEDSNLEHCSQRPLSKHAHGAGLLRNNISIHSVEALHPKVGCSHPNPMFLSSMDTDNVR